MTSTRLLARNSALNLASHVLPLVVAVMTFGPLTRGLGTGRFGVLTLAWALIGYFGLFDFGIGRALTQAASAAIGRGDQKQLDDLGASGIFALFILGVVGGLIVLIVTPPLAYGVLKMDDSLRPEAARAFYLLAASLPFVLSTLGIRGLLEAHQHFGAATALRLPYALFNFIGPLLVLPFTNDLVAIVGVLVVGRVLTWIAHLTVGLRRYPWLRRSPIGSMNALRPLIRIGGWMTVSNIISPLMVNLDRFLIGAFLSMAAVAHYVTPFEMVTKLLFIPASILGVFFPAFAASYVQDRERTAQLLHRVTRLLIAVMFPAMLVVIAFGREGLMLTVGAEYARESTRVLQLLAVGVFLNTIAQVPYSLLQAAGRPDLTARLHVLELPIYLLMIVLLAAEFQLVGVAMAWTLRVALDAAVLLWLGRRQLAEWQRGMWFAVGWIAAFSGTVIGVATIPGLLGRFVAVTAILIGFAILAWRHLIEPEERSAIYAVLRRGGRGIAPAT